MFSTHGEEHKLPKKHSTVIVNNRSETPILLKCYPRVLLPKQEAETFGLF